MKKLISAIAIVSILAISSLSAVAATSADHQNRKMGNSSQTNDDVTQHFNKYDVGIGPYGGQAQ